MDDAESKMVVVSSAYSILQPIYAIVMTGLSTWLLRRTHIKGSVVLVAGFGGTVLIHVASRILMSLMFNSWGMVRTTANELPGWFWTSTMLLTLLGLVCNVTIVIGFWILCRDLVGRLRTANPVSNVISQKREAPYG